MYDDDPIIQKTKQPIPDARFITFLKEGSVGIRLTGGNYAGIFVTAVQPGSPASLQGLQPGDKILKVNDMDMAGVTREDAVLFLLSLQDRIELIVQYCKEEYDNIVASQKGDSFYIKTHFHYDSPAKGEMSFRSGDIFHVIDTLYNGVVGCWQVFRIGRNNQEVQKGIIPNKSRAEELATAQFNATKKEMSANESRGSFFRRRRSSNRRSKSLGKEHWDDILFSDTVSKFPAYERVLLKHPGFTRPVIMFGPIADVAREKLLKDFPDKFISPQLDNSAEENNTKSKTSNNSNIIRLSAIRDVIATGKHALLDITPNAVERLNYAQMYPIVVFFKAETKIVIKQLRQGLPKSAHKSSKKLLEQCQKLDKVWSHVFSATVTLNDNTDTWYRKVREIIDKQQSGALWMSESKASDPLPSFFYAYPYLQPKSTNSLPHRHKHSRSRRRKTALSMYSSPRLIHREPSPCICSYMSYYDEYDFDLYHANPEESLSDDFLFPMSSLRLSYASSPESDLEHSPGPPNTSGDGVGGRLTKASSDPSVVMSEGGGGGGGTDVLPPYQPTYDTRYGFNNTNAQQDQPSMPSEQLDTPTDSPLTKEPTYTLSNQDISSMDPQGPYPKNSMDSQGPYSGNPQDYSKSPPYSAGSGKPPDYSKMDSRNDYGSRNDTYGSPDRRQDFSPERNMNVSHKRQISTLHGGYKGMNEHSPMKEGVYGQVPDLPPRVDRAAKPMGLLTTPGKIPNGRSAHERLFGAKANPQLDGNMNENGNFNPKAGSLERSQNSKSDSLSSYDSFNKQPRTIGPNAHDDLKTTLSKIDPNLQNSPSKYPPGTRWDGRRKQEGKYGTTGMAEQFMENSPRSSQEIEKDGSLECITPRGSVERDIYKYSRSPGKQSIPTKTHIETKTDYGKYSRNAANHPHNSSQQQSTPSHSSHPQPPPHIGPPPPISAPEYARSSHQDLRDAALSVHRQQSPLRSPQARHNGFEGGYKPVPPPKPKNYRPPYNGAGHQQQQYQHGKSHSNPVDPRLQQSSHQHHHANYYYDSPQNHNSYHGDQPIRYPGYDMAPPYHQESPRRHPSISYASRSEIQSISYSAHPHDSPYKLDHSSANDMLDTRPPVVDLQGSREQRGSAFELYRKPISHNMRIHYMLDC
nr:unnamed protein product [Callosobruchus analis]